MKHPTEIIETKRPYIIPLPEDKPCANCGKHFPVKEFVWTDDGKVVGS